MDQVGLVPFGGNHLRCLLCRAKKGSGAVCRAVFRSGHQGLRRADN